MKKLPTENHGLNGKKRKEVGMEVWMGKKIVSGDKYKIKMETVMEVELNK